jgi:hypothetical protein
MSNMGLALHQVHTDDSKSDAVVGGVHPSGWKSANGILTARLRKSSYAHWVGRRNAMDLSLTGTEVHSLRETLETAIFEMGRKIASLADPGARKELEKSRDALRSIKEKLPAGLIETG